MRNLNFDIFKSYLHVLYHMHAVCTELIYDEKRLKRSLSLPHNEAHANKSSFICESVFLQKAEETGERRWRVRQTDKVSEEKMREEEKLYVDTELAVQGRKQERGKRSKWETGFVFQALQLIDRMRACLTIQGVVSCHWRRTGDWRVKMQRATIFIFVC